MGKEEDRARYSLRRATEADYDFLYALHVAAMREYVERLWGWEDAWQREYFAKKFDPQKYRIIQIENQDAGVLVVEQQEHQIYLGLIEILPEFQGRGVGTAVINNIFDQARARKVAVGLHVLKSNDRARRLYERLGFVIAGEEGYRIAMVKKFPDPTEGSST